MTEIDEIAARAAAAVATADALLICAGAGMGVDSGLPDFRGPEGFWRAYPAARELGLQFHDLADPRWFTRDPALAWGFYGHRLNLYRATVPHAGFALLRRWAARRPAGAFVYTSNVDGQFQRAGFSEAQVEECHGSILHLQCLQGCDLPPWPVPQAAVSVDVATLRAAPPFFTCPRCAGLARPNIMMFSDFAWDSTRANEQRERSRAWLQAQEQAGARVAVLCLGSGTAIQTVRLTAERAARRPGNTLIRINPRDPWVPSGQLSLATGALAGLTAIDAALG
jgi:NAD-dependent SIR2 family protein deacetylase